MRLRRGRPLFLSELRKRELLRLLSRLDFWQSGILLLCSV